MRKKVTFLLVHGTFARQAKWTMPESPLCQTIISAISSARLDADIRAVRWSGRNTVRDRIAAGLEIARQLKNVDRKTSPHVFLIGHSHGGSAIAHFLLNRKHGESSVSGCAFLSTPFIAARVRPDAFIIYAGLLAILSILSFILLNALLSIVIGGAMTLLIKEFGGSNLLALAIDAAAALIVGIALRGQLRVFRKMLAQSESRIASNETARLEADNCLLVRCTRDEAAIALAFGQFVAALAAAIASTMMSIAGYTSLFVARLRKSRVYFIIVVACALFYSFFIAEILVAAAFGDFGHIWHGAFVRDTFNFPLASVEMIFNFILRKVLWIPFAIVTSFLLGGLTLYLIASILNGIVIWSFGWVNFLDAFFAEVSVEPTPFGAHEFHHISWLGDARAPLWTNLGHSASYHSQLSLDAFRKWLLKMLGETTGYSDALRHSD